MNVVNETLASLRKPYCVGTVHRRRGRGTRAPPAARAFYPQLELGGALGDSGLARGLRRGEAASGLSPQDGRAAPPRRPRVRRLGSRPSRKLAVPLPQGEPAAHGPASANHKGAEAASPLPRLLSSPVRQAGLPDGTLRALPPHRP